MLPILRGLEAAADTTAMRLQLAGMLGLDEPVVAEVLERARSDDRYAGYLLRSRGHPELLDMLLAAASGPAAGRSPPSADAPPSAELSNAELLKKAGGAVLKWASGGFQRLDPTILERRLAACAACPHLREPPDRLLYKVALSPRSDQRVCGACGCTASRKASLPGEACPVEDPDRPGRTRWREPLRRSSEESAARR